MDERMTQLLNKAKALDGEDIKFAGFTAKRWGDCFTEDEEDGLVLWYNVDGNTKIIVEKEVITIMDEHTAIIANMCDGCGHITPSSKGYDVCKLHPNTLTLECTINNLPCPDYTKEVI